MIGEMKDQKKKCKSVGWGTVVGWSNGTQDIVWILQHELPHQAAVREKVESQESQDMNTCPLSVLKEFTVHVVYMWYMYIPYLSAVVVVQLVVVV